MAAILVAGLGVGCALAVLAFGYHVYRNPLPFPEGDRLVVVARQTPEFPFGPISVLEYEDLKQRQHSFEHLALTRPVSRTYQPSGEAPQQVSGTLVSWSLLRILGLTPQPGRDFAAEDDLIGSPPMALISQAFWQSHLGGRREAIGQPIPLDGRLVTVIGVLPPGLERVPLVKGVELGDIWLPISLYFNRDTNPERADRLGTYAVGRLADSASFEQARDDMARIGEELSREHPQTNRKSAILAVRLRDHIMGSIKPYVLALLATTGLVLIATVFNLGNLALAGTLARRRELATRQALGAERSNVACLLFAESAVLAIAGAGVGILVAIASGSLIRALMPESIGRGFEALSLPVLGASLPLVVGLVIFMSVPSVLFVTGPGALRMVGGTRNSDDDCPGGRRLRRFMVIAEVAIAAALLVGAGLLAASLAALQSVDPGFRADALNRFRMAPEATGPLAHADRLALVERLVERLEAVPGVDSAAVSSLQPLDFDANNGARIVAGDRQQPALTDMEIGSFIAVTPGYFRVMGIDHLRGRVFDPLTDAAGVEPPAIIISQSLVRRFWPDPDDHPTHHQLGFELLGNPAEFTVRMRRVVGVVGDVLYQSLDQPSQHAVYVPMAQPPTYFDDGTWPPLVLAARSTLPVMTLGEEIRRILADLAPGVALYDHGTMSDVVAAGTMHRRHLGQLVQALAVLAVVLAAIGIYGIISAAVAAERRVIGVRAALGANPGSLVLGYLLRAAVLVAAGLLIGLAGALILAPRVMGSFLFGVTPYAPLPYFVGILVLATTALAAALIPALRATRVSPTEVLRDE